MTQLSPAQLESILLHELAHIRRMDFLTNIAVAVMETMLFYNPFARLLVHAVRRERELCCDDLVLANRQDAWEYASALLSLEKARHMPSIAMALASNGTGGHLLHRVRRITSAGAEKRPYADRLLALCLMFLLMGSMAWLKPDITQAHTRKALDTNITIVNQRTWADAVTGPSKIVPLERKKNVAKKMVTAVIARNEVAALENVQAEIDNLSTFDIHLDETALNHANAFRQQHLTNLHGQSRDADMLLADLSRQALLDAFVLRNKEAGQSAPAFSWNSKTTEEPEQLPEGISWPSPEVPTVGIFPGVVARKARTVQDIEREIRVLNESMNKEKLFLFQSTEAPQRTKAEKVTVNRIKTKDGFSLRIETGKESIDILINESDIVEEKDHN